MSERFKYISFLLVLMTDIEKVEVTKTGWVKVFYKDGKRLLLKLTSEPVNAEPKVIYHDDLEGAR